MDAPFIFVSIGGTISLYQFQFDYGLLCKNISHIKKQKNYTLGSISVSLIFGPLVIWDRVQVDNEISLSMICIFWIGKLV